VADGGDAGDAEVRTFEVDQGAGRDLALEFEADAGLRDVQAAGGGREGEALRGLPVEPDLPGQGVALVTAILLAWGQHPHLSVRGSGGGSNEFSNLTCVSSGGAVIREERDAVMQG